MHWLLAGYMWLFIHRPFEVWPWLGELRIERVYMLLTLGCWLLASGKGWTPNRFNLAVAGLSLAIIVSWVASPHRAAGTTTVEGFAKVAVFYVLLVSCIRDEAKLRFILIAFLVCTALYMAHCLREYMNGRHAYTMGTARMIGVDVTLGHPNSLGASLVCSLPITIPFWYSVQKRWEICALAGYTCLTVVCVLLTGSRTGFMGLVVAGSVMLMLSRYRWRLLLAAIVLAPIVWMSLPEDRQMRFLTILDPSVGPANAQDSAEARERYFWIALDLWKQNPIIGHGPDTFRHLSGTRQPAHTLYGELLSEVGMLGAGALAGLVICAVMNARDIARCFSGIPWSDRSFPFWVSVAVCIAMGLLMFLGLGGDNMYRFNWLWYGAFSVIAVRCIWDEQSRSNCFSADVSDALDGQPEPLEMEVAP